jgi:hypothetical protein
MRIVLRVELPEISPWQQTSAMCKNACLGLVTIELQVKRLFQLTRKGSAHTVSLYYEKISDLTNLWLVIGMDRW